MKKIFLTIAAASAFSLAGAQSVLDFWAEHTHRLSLAVNLGGIGGKNHYEGFSTGLFGSIYGFSANITYCTFDDFDVAYPFCKGHERQEPILSEYLFGYSFPVWSNFDKQHESGYTLYLAPMYGWFDMEYSHTRKGMYEYYPDHTVRKASFGAVATLEFFKGVIINVKGSPYCGELGVGYSFYGPARKRDRKWFW